MKCPYCDELEDKVIDSRPTYDDKAIRRRRECLVCHKRFTTFEQLEERRVMVVKKDGRREPFSRDKILQGLILACRKRPVSIQALEEITTDIEREITNRLDAESQTVEIGRIVMDKLLRIDPVAYVRFASVYQEFNDHKQFDDVIHQLKKLSVVG